MVIFPNIHSWNLQNDSDQFSFMNSSFLSFEVDQRLQEAMNFSFAPTYTLFILVFYVFCIFSSFGRSGYKECVFEQLFLGILKLEMMIFYHDYSSLMIIIERNNIHSQKKEFRFVHELKKLKHSAIHEFSGVLYKNTQGRDWW